MNDPSPAPRRRTQRGTRPCSHANRGRLGATITRLLTTNMMGRKACGGSGPTRLMKPGSYVGVQRARQAVGEIREERGGEAGERDEYSDGPRCEISEQSIRRSRGGPRSVSFKKKGGRCEGLCAVKGPGNSAWHIIKGVLPNPS